MPADVVMAGVPHVHYWQLIVVVHIVETAARSPDQPITVNAACLVSCDTCTAMSFHAPCLRWTSDFLVMAFRCYTAWAWCYCLGLKDAAPLPPAVTHVLVQVYFHLFVLQDKVLPIKPVVGMMHDEEGKLSACLDGL